MGEVGLGRGNPSGAGRSSGIFSASRGLLFGMDSPRPYREARIEVLSSARLMDLFGARRALPRCRTGRNKQPNLDFFSGEMGKSEVNGATKHTLSIVCYHRFQTFEAFNRFSKNWMTMSNNIPWR